VPTGDANVNGFLAGRNIGEPQADRGAKRSALLTANGLRLSYCPRAGALSAPLNVAVVPSKAGSRVTVPSGISLRRW
jgi:hypothetical protein